MSALRVVARPLGLAVLIIIAGALSGCASGQGNRDYADTSFSGVNSSVAIPGQYTSPHSVY